MSASIETAVAALRNGGIIAYPTEAVWGLGCDPRNEAAVRRVLALKERDIDMGLLLIASEFDQLSGFLGPCPEPAIERARATWPGPHTWILPASTAAPAWITGKHSGIGVRVTAHPTAAAICRGFGGALVSTSANRHGETPALTLAEVQAGLGPWLDAIVAGDLGGLERPTPIRDAVSGEVVRS